jgi:hypothetical protein
MKINTPIGASSYMPHEGYQRKVTVQLIKLSEKNLGYTVEHAKQLEVEKFLPIYKAMIYEALPYNIHKNYKMFAKKEIKQCIGMSALLGYHLSHYEIKFLVNEQNWIALNAACKEWIHAWSIETKHLLVKCAKHLKRRFRNAVLCPAILNHLDNGFTVLHTATSSGELMSYLRRGANPYILSVTNKTALQMQKGANMRAMFSRYLWIHEPISTTAKPFVLLFVNDPDVLFVFY